MSQKNFLMVYFLQFVHIMVSILTESALVGITDRYSFSHSVWCVCVCVFVRGVQLRDEDLPKDMQECNWFSAPSALRVYGQYLNLDKDHNGMLSKEELARWVGLRRLDQ